MLIFTEEEKMMIEKTLKDFLDTNENITVPVYLDIPRNPADSYLTVEKIGAGRTDKIEACTMSIDANAQSKYETVLLSEKVKKAMEELGESDLVFSVNMGGETDSTNTSQKLYCYTTIWNIYF